MTAEMTEGVPQADGSIARRTHGWTCEDVARAVVYMASLPLDANVALMTVMATKMPFVGSRLTTSFPGARFVKCR